MASGMQGAVGGEEPRTILLEAEDRGTPELLAHETTHVLQQLAGLRHAPDASWGNEDVDPYDYGGPEGLREAYKQRKGVESFGAEQQASIVGDFYKIRGGARKLSDPKDIGLYGHYIQQMKTAVIDAPPTTAFSRGDGHYLLLNPLTGAKETWRLVKGTLQRLPAPQK